MCMFIDKGSGKVKIWTSFDKSILNMLKYTCTSLWGRGTRKVEVHGRCLRAAAVAARAFLSLCKHGQVQSVDSFYGEPLRHALGQRESMQTAETYAVFSSSVLLAVTVFG